jgi:hypothetical protein
MRYKFILDMPRAIEADSLEQAIERLLAGIKADVKAVPDSVHMCIIRPAVCDMCDADAVYWTVLGNPESHGYHYCEEHAKEAEKKAQELGYQVHWEMKQ